MKKCYLVKKYTLKIKNLTKIKKINSKLKINHILPAWDPGQAWCTFRPWDTQIGCTPGTEAWEQQIRTHGKRKRGIVSSSDSYLSVHSAMWWNIEWFLHKNLGHQPRGFQSEWGFLFKLLHIKDNKKQFPNDLKLQKSGSLGVRCFPIVVAYHVGGEIAPKKVHLLYELGEKDIYRFEIRTPR